MNVFFLALRNFCQLASHFEKSQSTFVLRGFIHTLRWIFTFGSGLSKFKLVQQGYRTHLVFIAVFKDFDKLVDVDSEWVANDCSSCLLIG